MFSLIWILEVYGRKKNVKIMKYCKISLTIIDTEYNAFQGCIHIQLDIKTFRNIAKRSTHATNNILIAFMIIYAMNGTSRTHNCDDF